MTPGDEPLTDEERLELRELEAKQQQRETNLKQRQHLEELREAEEGRAFVAAGRALIAKRRSGKVFSKLLDHWVPRDPTGDDLRAMQAELRKAGIPRPGYGTLSEGVYGGVLSRKEVRGRLAPPRDEGRPVPKKGHT